jgi:hypothetical protein
VLWSQIIVFLYLVRQLAVVGAINAAFIFRQESVWIYCTMAAVAIKTALISS